MKTKDHIKFCLNVVLFILSFGLCCFVMTFIMRPLGYDAEHITGFYAEEKNSLNVVYIGGSACFTYWMPIEGYKNAGFTSYNYAVNTLPPEVYRYFASEVKKYQDPELLVFDARAFQWRKNYKTSRSMELGYRTATTYMRYGTERSSIINNLIPEYLEPLDPGQDLATYHFDLAKYHGRRDEFSFKDSLKMMLGLYHNPSRGFFSFDEIDHTVTKEANPAIMDTKPIDTEDALKDLLTYLKNNNQKALFVISPYAETIDEKKEINTIAKIVKEAGFDFIDTNDYVDIMGIDYSKDFYNAQHTNPSGAVKYSAFLSEYIKTHYVINDQRGQNPNWDSAIEAWNDTLNERLQNLEAKQNANF